MSIIFRINQFKKFSEEIFRISCMKLPNVKITPRVYYERSRISDFFSEDGIKYLRFKYVNILKF